MSSNSQGGPSPTEAPAVAFAEPYEWGDVLVLAVAFAVLGFPASIIAGVAGDLGVPGADELGSALWASFNLLAAWSVGRFRRRTTVAHFALRRVGRGALGAGLLAGVAALGVDLLQASAMPSLPPDGASGSAAPSDWSLGAAVFYAVLVAPVCEEFFFRGALWSVLEERGGRWLAALATSLLFAAAHFQWIKLPGTLAFALMAAALRWRFGSVVPGMVAHVVANGLLAAVVLAAWAGR
jgi:membrane protease YdiL (CAAX protease family)